MEKYYITLTPAESPLRSMAYEVRERTDKGDKLLAAYVCDTAGAVAACRHLYRLYKDSKQQAE